MVASPRLRATIERGTGPPVLFVHGYPLNRAMWTPQLVELSASHRVVLLDLPGFGAATDEPVPATLEGFAESVRSVIEGELGGRATVVGHSFGGYVLLQLYRDHPDLFDRAILVSTRSGADSADAREKRLATVRRLADPTEHLDADEVTKSLLAETTWTAGGPVRDQVRSMVTSASNSTVSRTLTAIASRPDFTPVLARIRVPTLVVWGTLDRLIPPPQTQALADGIANAQRCELIRAGHLGSLETPDEFNAAVRSFLRATDAPRGT